MLGIKEQHPSFAIELLPGDQMANAEFDGNKSPEPASDLGALDWHRQISKAVLSGDGHPWAAGDGQPQGLIHEVQAQGMLYREKLTDRIYDFSKPAAPFPPEPGQTSRYLTTVDGEKASYLVHMPTNPKPPMDLVLVFHGYGMRRGQGNTEKGADGFEEVSGFSKRADADGKLLVYVEGNPDSSYSFNNGQWWFSKRNDLKLVDGIIDSMRQSGLANNEKVSAIGYSQGGSFVHTLINARPDTFGTAAELGGWMNSTEHTSVLPVNILSIQAKDDTTAPPDGRKWWLTMLPEAHTQEFYSHRDGVTEAPRVSSVSLADGTEVTTESRGGNAASEVRTVWLSKGNHLWWGGKGAENFSFNASDAIWSYLKEKW